MKGPKKFDLLWSLLFLTLCNWGQCENLHGSNNVSTAIFDESHQLNDHRGSFERWEQNPPLAAHFQNAGRCGTQMNNVTHVQTPSSIGLERINKPWGTVEVLVVIDKDLGDSFGHNRKAILDYLTVYFWDISLRFRTLPGVSLNFRVTDVIIISFHFCNFLDLVDQPFIQEAKHNGFVNYTAAVKTFNRWLFSKSSSSAFPKFDVAILFSKTQDPRNILGVAHTGGACRIDHRNNMNLNGAIVSDSGKFDSLLVAAHEIGHVLGAEHDIDPAGCEGIYIMNATISYEKRWYFSRCSNGAIGNFLRTNEASCLKRIDSRRPLPIDTDFSSVKAPDMTKQCKMRLNNSAFVTERDSWDCKRLRCSFHVGSQINSVEFNLDLDNTPCGRDRRCFRGECRKQGYLLVNIWAGKCLSTVDKFNGKSSLTLTKCPKPSTGSPLDRFVVTTTANGKLFQTPFQASGASHVEACLTYKNSVGRRVFADTCDITQSYQKWELIDLAGGNFLIRHRATKKCMKLKWNKLRLSLCNKYDAKMKWKLI